MSRDGADVGTLSSEGEVHHREMILAGFRNNDFQLLVHEGDRFIRAINSPAVFF